MKDPELVETARKIRLEVDSTTGAEAQALAEGLHHLPASVMERAQKLLAKK